MKIGIVCYPTYGGSGVVATELGKALALRGHTVHFITYERPFRLDAFLQNIYYHQVEPRDYPLFAFPPYESALTSKMVDVCQYEKLDVLHVHYAIPHAASAFLARQILLEQGIRMPFVTTLHGTDITLVGTDPAYKPVVCFSIEHSNAVTCVSDYLRLATQERFEVSKPIDVIPNFVDLKRFKPSETRCTELRKRVAPHGEKIILHVSNFRKVKRIDDLWDTYVKLRERLSVRLLLVGDGPERAQLEQKVRQGGYGAEVHFLGNQVAVEDILPMGDLFLFPSENESFGLAALEAMAAGLPVVGSASGGVTELVEHGVSGMLCPLGDTDAMAAAAYTILSDPALFDAFRAAARSRASTFSEDAIVPLYEGVYHRVIEAYAPTPNLV